MTRALVVSIHDVAPRWLDEVSALRGALARWGVDRVTLLAVPHFHHGVRLADHAPTVAWLRARARAGDEIALHGYHHVQAGPPASARARWRARLVTAGEGECLAPHGDLEELLGRGRAELSAALGVAPRGFVAPAWLEPARLSAMLERLGFSWHETALTMEALSPRRRVVAPAIGFATRSAWRELAALAWAAAAVRLARRAQVVRVAVHPGDLRSAAVMAGLARTIELAARGRRAVTTARALGATPDAASVRREPR